MALRAGHHRSWQKILAAFLTLGYAAGHGAEASDEVSSQQRKQLLLERRDALRAELKALEGGNASGDWYVMPAPPAQPLESPQFAGPPPHFPGALSPHAGASSRPHADASSRSSNVDLHGFMKYKDTNCLRGAGGEELGPGTSSEVANSAKDCAHRCETTDQCSCFSYDGTGKECLLKRRCVPTSCKVETSYDTYIKRDQQESRELAHVDPTLAWYYDTGCWSGFGTELGIYSDHSPLSLSLANCARTCRYARPTFCNCFMYDKENSLCYPRKSCSPVECRGGGLKLDTYVAFP
eukprot:TRINITY_DN50469_c0_g2_i1.p1 TRINITY_DN50469_c0_g2~~TRINITY_DN50469_c0_g2_i1.p1  ORF type:complete len:294 (-),score=33.24 TRINITY_DN50469_c0_g2_i1:141-1022(-)